MKYIAFDVETTGFLKYEGDKIFSYSTTDWHGNTEVVRLDGKDRKKNIKKLKDFWADTSIAKIGHNIKFDMSFVDAMGIEIPRDTEIHDTMIMHQMLMNLAKSHALDNLALKYYSYPLDQDENIKKHIQKYQREHRKTGERINASGYHTVPHDLMHKYQVADTERTMLLYQLFVKELYKDKPMWNDYLNEMHLLYTSMRMEKFGILTDVRQANKLIRFLDKEIQQNRKDMLKLVGKDVNYNSSKQVAELIYDDLGFKCRHNTKSGARGVPKEMLLEQREKESHPIFDKILKERAYTKGHSMVSSYLDMMHPETKRMHPNLRTNQARTGRQSCSDPNLQNVSKEISVNTVYGVPARNCFRCDPGHVLFFIDYAGIEFRLIVDDAGEDEFIEVMANGGDVHDVASSELYGENWDLIEQLVSSPAGVKLPDWITHIPEEDYKGDFKLLRYQMRAGAKNYEFGVAYGGAFAAITKDLIGLTPKQKREGNKRFAKRWPKVHGFTKDKIAQVRKTGFVTTAFGRKLYVERDKAYTASNYVIQGTAAGILKRAENRVDDWSYYEVDDRIRNVVTVHDELVLSYPREFLPKNDIYLPKIAELMTSFKEIKVPLEVEFEMSHTNWSNVQEIKVH